MWPISEEKTEWLGPHGNHPSASGPRCGPKQETELIWQNNPINNNSDRVLYQIPLHPMVHKTMMPFGIVHVATQKFAANVHRVPVVNIVHLPLQIQIVPLALVQTYPFPLKKVTR